MLLFWLWTVTEREVRRGIRDDIPTAAENHCLVYVRCIENMDLNLYHCAGTVSDTLSPKTWTSTCIAQWETSLTCLVKMNWIMRQSDCWTLFAMICFLVVFRKVMSDVSWSTGRVLMDSMCSATTITYDNSVRDFTCESRNYDTVHTKSFNIAIQCWFASITK